MDNSMPAFPSPEFLGDSGLGLTRLEAFTMAAMQGLAAMQVKSDIVYSSLDEAYAQMAQTAVGIARATLAELSKHQ
jgi:hypothetical protein